jgi:hypothetical protein
MSSAEFELETEIQISLERLHSFLCDLHNFVPLHPLIESIDEIPPTSEIPHARWYRVVDRIAIGPFRVRTAYTAALEPISDREVHGHAWQSPGVRLRTVYALEATESGTRLAERVSVEAPRILRGFVVSQAQRSHEETLGKMKALLESGP